MGLLMAKSCWADASAGSSDEIPSNPCSQLLLPRPLLQLIRILPPESKMSVELVACFLPLITLLAGEASAERLSLVP